MIKSIFSKLSFLEPEDVESWVNDSAEALLDEQYRPLINRNLTEDSRTKIRSRLTDDAIFGGYFEALKKNNVTEGVFNQRHIMTSTSEDKSYRPIFDALRTVNADSRKILD